MENKNERLILDGNAFYEIDLDCMKKHKKRPTVSDISKDEQKETKHKKRQRIIEYTGFVSGKTAGNADLYVSCCQSVGAFERHSEIQLWKKPGTIGSDQ